MAFVSLQGGNIATKERMRGFEQWKRFDSRLHVILQTYDSSVTVSKCPENNSHSARCD